MFEKYPNVKLLDKRDLFNCLMINEDIKVLRKLGKYVDAGMLHNQIQTDRKVK